MILVIKKGYLIKGKTKNGKIKNKNIRINTYKLKIKLKRFVGVNSHVFFQ